MDLFDKIEALTGKREVPKGLPDFFHRNFRVLRYDLRRYERALFQIERWWWGEVTKTWKTIREEAMRRDPHWTPETSRFEKIAEVAMFWSTALGLLSAAQQIAVATAQYDFSAPVLESLIAMAEPGESIDPAVEFLKNVILVAPPEETFQLYAERMPPIRHASTEIRESVRKTVAQAILEQMDDKTFQQRLQEIGRWPLARIRNQIRTETATMFNAGRFTRMHSDPAVVGYKYIVTLDDRTTQICRALVDKKVRKEDLHAIPPLHYQCRTVLDCIFAWQSVTFDSPHDLPEPGKGNFAQFQGFGQKKILQQTPLAPAPRVRVKRKLRKLRRKTAAETKTVFREVSATFHESDYDAAYSFWDKHFAGLRERTMAKIEVENRLVQKLSGNDVFARFVASPDVNRLVGISPSASEERINKIVASLIQQWARTSADRAPWSMALQIAAREEFGLSWAATSHFSANAYKLGEEIYKVHGEALRLFIRTMYEETQNFLADANIDELLLFRGIRVTVDSGIADCQAQPISSWSIDEGIASQFAGPSGTVVAARVPRECILSTVRTGFGCHGEREFTVLAPRGTVARIAMSETFDVHEDLMKIAQTGKAG